MVPKPITIWKVIDLIQKQQAAVHKTFGKSKYSDALVIQKFVFNIIY